MLYSLVYIYIGDKSIVLYINVHRDVTEYLDTVGVNRLQQPPLSQDINPIKNFWGSLRKRNRRSQPLPEAPSDLQNSARERWEQIQPETSANHIDNMLRRIEPLIRAPGGNASY